MNDVEMKRITGNKAHRWPSHAAITGNNPSHNAPLTDLESSIEDGSRALIGPNRDRTFFGCPLINCT